MQKPYLTSLQYVPFRSSLETHSFKLALLRPTQYRKLTKKKHQNTNMPIYSSDSDDHMAAPLASVFNRQRSFHAILGGGRVADTLLWRNKKISAAVFTVFTAIWSLFEIVEYPFVSLLCHVLIIMMLAVFLWSNILAGFINWNVPNIDNYKFSESTLRSLSANISLLSTKLYRIACGNDLKSFFVALSGLWIISVIGNYTSSLNLLYIVFVCMMTLPLMYERYEREVDYIATKGNRDAKRLYRKFSSRILSKIPRGPAREKKFT